MPGTLPRPRLVVAAPAIPFLCHEDEWTGNLVRLPACLLAAGRLVGRGGGYSSTWYCWRFASQKQATVASRRAEGVSPVGSTFIGPAGSSDQRWRKENTSPLVPIPFQRDDGKADEGLLVSRIFLGCGGDAHKEERRRRRDSHHHFFESFFRPASASVLIRTVIIIYT